MKEIVIWLPISTSHCQITVEAPWCSGHDSRLSTRGSQVRILPMVLISFSKKFIHNAALDPGVIGDLVGSDLVWSKSIEHPECPVGKGVETVHTSYA